VVVLFCQVIDSQVSGKGSEALQGVLAGDFLLRNLDLHLHVGVFRKL
jgi:hypothetical protein